MQFLIRTEDLQAGSQRHLRNLLELDQRGVLPFAGDRLAVLDVDVLRLVASVFYGVTVTRFRANASQTGHFRSNHLAAKTAQVFVGRNDGTMCGHGDGRK